ncbi:MAG: iron chelate uptake ABC transporter family permease subunit, partial [Acidobacteria bacterium]|nr:iron chelate uptake ABC transporter family permease subunit [Acidobacteriota bacterium]
MRRLSRKRVAALSLLLVAVWFAAALISLSVGSVMMPAGDGLRVIQARLLGWAPPDAAQDAILFSVRLPRILLASLVGAALAVAGAAFQSLLRNPLADPFVLGVSTGASMGTILYSIATAAWFATPGGGGLIFGRPLAAF